MAEISSTDDLSDLLASNALAFEFNASVSSQEPPFGIYQCLDAFMCSASLLHSSCLTTLYLQHRFCYTWLLYLQVELLIITLISLQC